MRDGACRYSGKMSPADQAGRRHWLDTAAPAAPDFPSRRQDTAATITETVIAHSCNITICKTITRQYVTPMTGITYMTGIAYYLSQVNMQYLADPKLAGPREF